MGAVVPHATRAAAQGRRDVLRDIHVRWTKYSNAVLLSLAVPAIVFAAPVLVLWLGDRFADAGVVAQILVAGMLLNNVHIVGTGLLTGLGRISAYARYQIAWAAGNLVVSVALVQWLGLPGVALGSAIPLIVLEPLFVRAALRELGQPGPRLPRRRARAPVRGGADGAAGRSCCRRSPCGPTRSPRSSGSRSVVRRVRGLLRADRPRRPRTRSSRRARPAPHAARRPRPRPSRRASGAVMTAHATVTALRERVLATVGRHVRAGARVALIDYRTTRTSATRRSGSARSRPCGRLGADVAYECEAYGHDARAVRRAIGPDGIVLLHGGGNFGDEWPEYQRLREGVIDAHRDRRVVVLPPDPALQPRGEPRPRGGGARRTSAPHGPLPRRPQRRDRAVAGAGGDGEAAVAPNAAFALGRPGRSPRRPRGSRCGSPAPTPSVAGRGSCRPPAAA